MYPSRVVHVPAGDWISLQEAADIIGCTKRNALNYIDAEKLPAVKIGEFWIVLRKDAEKFERPARGRPPKNPPPKGKPGRPRKPRGGRPAGA